MNNIKKYKSMRGGIHEPSCEGNKNPKPFDSFSLFFLSFVNFGALLIWFSPLRLIWVGIFFFSLKCSRQTHYRCQPTFFAFFVDQWRSRKRNFTFKDFRFSLSLSLSLSLLCFSLNKTLLLNRFSFWHLFFFNRVSFFLLNLCN